MSPPHENQWVALAFCVNFVNANTIKCGYVLLSCEQPNMHFPSCARPKRNDKDKCIKMENAVEFTYSYHARKTWKWLYVHIYIYIYICYIYVLKLLVFYFIQLVAASYYMYKDKKDSERENGEWMPTDETYPNPYNERVCFWSVCRRKNDWSRCNIKDNVDMRRTSLLQKRYGSLNDPSSK